MTIRVLPPQVADAIAAGEVVERPASVVKELVENALDAGARRVSVEVRGAGRTMIRVVDDGPGIPPGELRVAFQRHATSKVASLADLDSIATLGFRGEALASIAAVSDLECRSAGARVRLRAGEVVEEGAAMPVPGVTLEVRDLFATTPARLRFLKSEATEAAACLKVVQTYALLYPEVRFELSVEGRRALRTVGGGEARAAAASVMGEAVAAELLEVDGEGVGGLVSQPRLSRGSREGVLLAVNRRPIVSRALGFAVEECYQGALERGRYPITVLNLVVESGQVDVNVHPAKREVRFRDERAVFGRVQRAVRAALSGGSAYRLVAAAAGSTTGLEGPVLRSPTLHDGVGLDDGPPARRAQGPADVAAGGAAPAAAGPLRPLGQVLDGYLVAESGDGVVFVDQHAAHERLLYNRFRRRLLGERGTSQPLLLPETVDLDPAQAAAARDHADHLRALGFEVEEFGFRAVRVLAGPAETPPARIADALRDLLAALADARAPDAADRAAVSLACHSAVRFGDRLEPAEQRRLLGELEVAEDAITCPHGRPTRLVVEWRDLKRHFRRNY